MDRSQVPDIFGRIPKFATELGAGLSVFVIGTLGLILGSEAVSRLIAASFGTVRIGLRLFPVSLEFVTTSATAYAVALLLWTAVYAISGLGVTYIYLTSVHSGPDRRFVVKWPDRDGLRLLIGLTAVVPILLGGSTLLLGIASEVWLVPVLIVSVFLKIGPGYTGLSHPGAITLAVTLVTLVVGPALGALFHGVLQNALRRTDAALGTTAKRIAIGGTALVVGVIGASGPISLLLLVAIAATVGSAYERTGNLVVPMVAYAAVNAVSLTTQVLVLRVLAQTGVVFGIEIIALG